MNKLAILAVAGLAAAASAGPLSAGNGNVNASAATVNLADYANISYTRGSGNVLITVNFVSDIESWDLLGDLDNAVFALDVGGGQQATMHGIGWDTTQRALGASWLSEMGAYFDDNIAPDGTGLFLTPGFADSFPGTGSYSSGGIVDLSDNGIADIVLANGVLRLEFFESFDDVSGAVDGLWLEGSSFTLDMTIIPAPSALALLGLGGLVTSRRRR